MEEGWNGVKGERCQAGRQAGRKEVEMVMERVKKNGGEE